MKYILLIVVLVATGMWWFADNDSATPAAPDSTNNQVDVTGSTESTVPTADVSQSVTIYDGIAVPSNSLKVDVSNRGLTGSLKAEIRQLTNVQELDMSNNQLTGLPAEIGQLSQLRVLNLAHNPFTGLPYELGNLQNLEVLDLRGTNYAKADLEVIQAQLPPTTNVLID